MADDRKHDPYCRPCFYYAPYTMSCDYILREDHPRPCPGGNGCTARILRKDVKKMQAKWDTALGKQMWENGSSDKEIAEQFGIAVNTVSHQRRKKWERTAEASTPLEDISTPAVCLTETPVAKEQPPAVQPDRYGMLEEVPRNLSGIQAICTAEAIGHLWNWDSREDLLKARAAIDYLLKKGNV